ncbi:MAG: T9SS type A sorting domain-containing protein, partial [Nostoc sp.]
IQVSPNPTANTVNVQGVQGGSHISLLDANGKKLTEVVATGTSQSINLSTFASGVYLLRIQAADGSTSNVKVVKQ